MLSLEAEDYELLGYGGGQWSEQADAYMRDRSIGRLAYWKVASAERYAKVKNTAEFRTRSRQNAKAYYERMKTDPAYKQRRAAADAARYQRKKAEKK